MKWRQNARKTAIKPVRRELLANQWRNNADDTYVSGRALWRLGPITIAGHLGHLALELYLKAAWTAWTKDALEMDERLDADGKVIEQIHIPEEKLKGGKGHDLVHWGEWVQAATDKADFLAQPRAAKALATFNGYQQALRYPGHTWKIGFQQIRDLDFLAWHLRELLPCEESTVYNLVEACLDPATNTVPELRAALLDGNDWFKLRID